MASYEVEITFQARGRRGADLLLDKLSDMIMSDKRVVDRHLTYSIEKVKK